MSIVNFNISESQMHDVLTDQTIKLSFINNVKNKISAYSLDGVNIDFEASNIAVSDRGSVMNDFMRELTDSVHALSPELEVSFAAPAVNWSGWNFTGLAASCDYLFVMGYDFYGSWSDFTGPTAPLTGGSYNVTNTITSEYSFVTQNTPEKLILGVPYYGPHWIADGSNEGAGTLSYVNAERFRNTQPQSEIYGLKWSANFQNSWYSYLNGFEQHQVWFDNDSSLGLKYDLAIAKNLKGVGMWALGYDGARTELWNLINDKFGSGEVPVPSAPTEFNVIVLDESSIQLNYSVSKYAESYEVYSSSDGINFTLLEEAFTNTPMFNNLEAMHAYYFKVRAKNSSGISTFTDVLAAVPSTENKILIVNGFDRVANTNNTFDFISYYSGPLISNGYGLSSASNEVIFKDIIDLKNFDVVFWMLLDESSTDDTFNQLEQEKVKEYLQSGGNLFVSGAEIGWDLVAKGSVNDKDFYNNYLKANYISDAPKNEQGSYYIVEPIAGEIFDGTGNISFDNGTHGTIDVDWPDAISAINGSSNILKYVDVALSSGGAGVAYSGSFNGSFFQAKLIHLSFPFETVYSPEEITTIMANVLEYFDLSVNINELENIPTDFYLSQNYPNPFNPSTKIKYSIPNVVSGLPGGQASFSLSNVVLKVYDILGREVATLVNKQQAPGNYEITFVSSGLSSGTYFYTLKYGDRIETKKMILLK